MQCFLSNKQSNKPQAPRPKPTPPQPALNTHLEFEKFATFSEGVILDEIERHYKEEKQKQAEIDELYKKLLEKEKEKEDQKKEVVNRSRSCDKIKLPLSKPDVIAVGGLKPKINAVSKKLLSKPSSTVCRSRLPRWH